jgi:hypothetical protein
MASKRSSGPSDRGPLIPQQATSAGRRAVQLQHLVVMAEETPWLRALLASPGARGLVAWVLAAVKRETGYEAAGSVTIRNLLGVRKPWPDDGAGRTRHRTISALDAQVACGTGNTPWRCWRASGRASRGHGVVTGRARTLPIAITPFWAPGPWGGSAVTHLNVCQLSVF